MGGEVEGHGGVECITNEGMTHYGWCRFAGRYLRFTALGCVASGPCVGLGCMSGEAVCGEGTRVAVLRVPPTRDRQR